MPFVSLAVLPLSKEDSTSSLLMPCVFVTHRLARDSRTEGLVDEVSEYCLLFLHHELDELVVYSLVSNWTLVLYI